MELWNIFSTFVTVGVIAFGCYFIGYEIGRDDAKNKRKGKA